MCLFGPTEHFYSSFQSACSQVEGFSQPTTMVWLKGEKSDPRPGIHHDCEFIHVSYFHPEKKGLILDSQHGISRVFHCNLDPKTKYLNSLGGNSARAFNRYF